MQTVTLVLCATLLVLTAAGPSSAQQAGQDDHPDIRLFSQASAQDGSRAEDALRQIGAQWRVGYAGIIWDLARFVRPPGPQLFQFFSLIDFLQQQMGQQFGADLVRWHDWIWDQPCDPHPDYALFKGLLYSRIDRRFEEFFPRGVRSFIRLDEIAWGGVAVNGIPPLEYKLMFDHETHSLWNTFEGVPVVGSLAGSGVRLTPHAVVTTTWGEWRSKHPATTVLSLDTGHRRDYSEGAAYRDYFSTDELMFQVSSADNRLQNKEEVLVMLLDDPSLIGRRRPLAIAASFLQRNRVFHRTFAGRNLAVVTSAQGANRVYDAQDVRFVRHLDEQRVGDQMGRAWRITEAALALDGDPSVRRVRVPAQRAFWFGWYAQFPETELIE